MLSSSLDNKALVNAKHEFQRITTKCSKKLGFYWWKSYVGAAFWSNIESPVNLTLTLIATMVSAQASTDAFIQKQHYVIMTFVSVLLTTFNTFYRPLIQMNKNIDCLKKWYALGNELEKLYYTERVSVEDFRSATKDGIELLLKINSEVAEQGPETRNFFIDILHLFVRKTCIGDENEAWLSFVKTDEEDQRRHFDTSMSYNQARTGLFSCCTRRSRQSRHPSSPEVELVQSTFRSNEEPPKSAVETVQE